MLTNNISHKHVVNPTNYTLCYQNLSTTKHWHNVEVWIEDLHGRYCDWDNTVGSMYFTFDQLSPVVQALILSDTTPRVHPLSECYFTVGYECFCCRDPELDIELR